MSPAPARRQQPPLSLAASGRVARAGGAKQGPRAGGVRCAARPALGLARFPGWRCPADQRLARSSVDVEVVKRSELPCPPHAAPALLAPPAPPAPARSPPGSWCNATAIVACPAGTYSPLAGADAAGACKPCPDAAWTSPAGAAACTVPALQTDCQGERARLRSHAGLEGGARGRGSRAGRAGALPPLGWRTIKARQDARQRCTVERSHTCVYAHQTHTQALARPPGADGQEWESAALQCSPCRPGTHRAHGGAALECQEW